MNIWILNPYEPLPHEGTVRLRYASLAEALIAQGHSVTWWSTDWSHSLKRKRLEQGAGSMEDGVLSRNHLTTQLISVPAYRRNISLRRIWSHWCYARGIAKQAEGYAERRGKPDVVLFSVPPMEAGRVALKLGKKFGAKVVLDVMDAWPEALLLAAAPRGAGSGEQGAVGPPRPSSFAEAPADMSGTPPKLGGELLTSLGRVLLYPYMRTMRTYCREADEVCAQSKAFAGHARKYGASGEIPVFHLAAHRPSHLPPSHLPTPSALRLVYLGSMGRVYDLSTLAAAVILLSDQGVAIRLDVIGDGEQRSHLEAMVAAAGKTEAVHIHGYVQGEALDALMAEADVGIIPMHPESAVAIPYKAPHYLSHGLYVLSSLPGELMELLQAHQCGSFYRAGEVEDLKKLIQQLVDAPELLKQGRDGALRLFEEQFESQTVHAQMADWLTRVKNLAQNMPQLAVSAERR